MSDATEHDPKSQRNHEDNLAERADLVKQSPQGSQDEQTRQVQESHEIEPHRKRVPQLGQYGEYWEGPTPPPAILAQYNDALPNGAERIVAMLQRQEDHRISEEQKDGDHGRSMEREALALTRERVRGELQITARSQLYGLIILLAVIVIGGAGLILGILNHESVAAVVGGLLSAGGLATLAGIFFPQLRHVKPTSQEEDVNALTSHQERGSGDQGSDPDGNHG